MLTHTLPSTGSGTGCVQIPLPLGFSMRLTIRSAFCNFEKIPFSYSIDFSLPINRFTSAIFGKPEHVAKYRQGNDQKFPGYQVHFDGALFIAGTLTVTVSGNTYNCSLVDLVGEVSEKGINRNIQDLPVFSDFIAFQNSANYNPETDRHCCFPIINTQFFKDKGVTTKLAVYKNGPGGLKATNDNYSTEVLSYCFEKAAAYRVNALNPDNTVKLQASTIGITNLTEKNGSYKAGLATVVTPFYFLKNIIRDALKANGFHFSENILDESELFRRFCIYNNYDITRTGFVYSMFQTYQPSGIASAPGNVSLLDSLFSSVGKSIISYTRNYNATYITSKNHLPKMSFGNLLLSTQNLINVVFDILPNHTVNCFSREDLMSREAIDLDKYFLGAWYPGEKKNVALKFVREHDDSDQVFAEKYVDLSDRKSDIRQPVETWEALIATAGAQEGDIRKISSLGIFAEYKMITQTYQNEQTKEEFTCDVLGWEEITIGLQNGWFNYGKDEVEEIKTSWSTCYGTANDTLVNQPGNQNCWRAKNQDFKPRLLIYKGNNQGGNQTNDFSFEYDGATGILKTQWKRTAKWWANRLPIIGNFNFSTNALRSIIYNKCLPYRTSETAFFIEKIEVDLYIDRIGTAEVTAYKRE